MAPTAFPRPPVASTDDGRMRRVGFEIEVGGLGAAAVAAVVATVFDGRVTTDHAHCRRVETDLGTFTVELDTRFAHPGPADGVLEPGPWLREILMARDDLERWASGLYGDIATGLVPTEVVCPPVPLDRLDRLGPLVPALRAAGAEGTAQGLLYAFGTQLNVEAPALTAECITAYIQAYLLLSEWLRSQIEVDRLRILLPFVDRFPQGFRRLMLDPDHAPDMARLIDDVLAHNPTRNRELDLLPLLAAIDEGRVRRVLPDEKIKPRPTFHYRLPNTALDTPDWDLATEWRRWLAVEGLAADDTTRRRMMAHAREADAAGGSWSDWIDTLLDTLGDLAR